MLKTLTVAYCTRTIDPSYAAHVRSTCGVAGVEIMPVENDGTVSLAAAYNRVLAASESDCVVFIHDDLVFNTDGWGKSVLRHFNKSDYTVLGIAGTTDIGADGCWWQRRERMVGQVRHLHEGRVHVSRYSNSFGKAITRVVAVDGLFMAVRRTWAIKPFDERFPGFHFYDIPFCLANHLEQAKVGVVHDIDVTHRSIGATGEAWESNRQLFSELFREQLPAGYVPPIPVLHKHPHLPKSGLPKVCVVIPTKDHLDLLSDCLRSFTEHCHYPDLHILVCDTGSTPDNLTLIRDTVLTASRHPVTLVEYGYYNYAKINNDAVANHLPQGTGLVVFCNNDIELVNDAISWMIHAWLQNPAKTGTVGARLHYPDQSVQHSGMLGIVNRQAKHFGVTHYGLNSYHTYYGNTVRDTLGNTAALMLVSLDLFRQIGGFDENYIECFEDVKINFQIIVLGKENVFCGEAVAIHRESQTRNADPNKLKRLEKDYSELLVPYVQKNLNKLMEYFTVI